MIEVVIRILCDADAFMAAFADVPALITKRRARDLLTHMQKARWRFVVCAATRSWHETESWQQFDLESKK
jgi:hypothetical protein